MLSDSLATPSNMPFNDPADLDPSARYKMVFERLEVRQCTASFRSKNASHYLHNLYVCEAFLFCRMHLDSSSLALMSG